MIAQEPTMQRLTFGLAAAIVLVSLVGEVNAQVSGNVHRQKLYSGYYNGYGYQPGLSIYPQSGMYSLDYQNQHVWRHYGYTPPRSGRMGNRNTRYNGLYGASNQWMFYYDGSQHSAYSIDSPIWYYGK